VVLVPDELALDFDQLDVVVVDGGHDPGVPVVVEPFALLVKVYLGVQFTLVFIGSLLTSARASARLIVRWRRHHPGPLSAVRDVGVILLFREIGFSLVRSGGPLPASGKADGS
jgi:hypothetical protein